MLYMCLNSNQLNFQKKINYFNLNRWNFFLNEVKLGALKSSWKVKYFFIVLIELSFNLIWKLKWQICSSVLKLGIWKNLV